MINWNQPEQLEIEFKHTAKFIINLKELWAFAKKRKPDHVQTRFFVRHLMMININDYIRKYRKTGYLKDLPSYLFIQNL